MDIYASYMTKRLNTFEEIEKVLLAGEPLCCHICFKPKPDSFFTTVSEIAELKRVFFVFQPKLNIFSFLDNDEEGWHSIPRNLEQMQNVLKELKKHYDDDAWFYSYEKEQEE
jgi:hypothetical protein